MKGLDQFAEQVAQRNLAVAVVGLGYVGLPLALAFAEAGFKVHGYDTDPDKIAALAGGRTYLPHIKPERILAARDRMRVGSNPTEASLCDAVLVCVPTPLDQHRQPDMQYIVKTAEALRVRRGCLVVLESTTYPGTTEGLLRDILERETGLEAGTDFALAFSPEREDPGNASYSTCTIPKLVGGLTPECGERAALLYGAVLESVVPVRNARTAEMSKLHENIFRCVNIALVNEMKVLCEAMGVDIWEVIQAASTKPFGFMPFYPGPGLGGHCIPIDPFYLTWKAREFDLPTRFIELAGEVNTRMPDYVVSRVAAALNSCHKSVSGADVLVLGVAYKRNVGDVRESPALPIMRKLLLQGARVAYHDEHVPGVKPSRHFDLKKEFGAKFLDGSVSLGDLEFFDVVVVVTDHAGVPYQRVADESTLVVDCRNVVPRRPWVWPA